MPVLFAAMRVDLVVLNYNGRALLAECLPSLVRAAEASSHACRVRVIDNASTDDSLAWLATHFPQVEVIASENLGLCSFNHVLQQLDCQVAVLLNNDIKLDPRAVDPLVEPLISTSSDAEARCFMTAPQCWLFDGQTYEGMRTAVRWRYGLVQATALFPGHETGIHQPGDTASAGAVLAVDRRIFLELGGFDPLYLPGRLEDLDFAFRGYQAGYHARYVPEAVAWHRGAGTFGPAFGAAGCDWLALRNTLLFQWKNLRHPRHFVRQAGGVAARLLLDVLRAATRPADQRFAFARAFRAAWQRWRQAPRHSPPSDRRRRELEFFKRFHPRRMNRFVGSPFA